MGTELVPEMSENLHILMRLSAQEHFIEFCHLKSFKTVTVASTVATSATVTTIIADADLNVSAVIIDE